MTLRAIKPTTTRLYFAMGDYIGDPDEEQSSFSPIAERTAHLTDLNGPDLSDAETRRMLHRQLDELIDHVTATIKLALQA